ncbi:hypothetical protein PVAP13_9KG043457 [Panicum virgatum]|uniref:Uncharacterized protein n=1 Tax=Panicum virgatum TaxID=38727 RepID=A0A8T0NEX7_PANVG|nr:hypothetical protein PVAP13_9KG043457 [Panicum virgatum]
MELLQYFIQKNMHLNRALIPMQLTETDPVVLIFHVANQPAADLFATLASRAPSISEQIHSVPISRHPLNARYKAPAISTKSSKCATRLQQRRQQKIKQLKTWDEMLCQPVCERGQRPKLGRNADADAQQKRPTPTPEPPCQRDQNVSG